MPGPRPSSRLPALLLALLPLMGLVLAGCGGEVRPRPGDAPRHLVLLTFEGLRADHTSAYLYPRPTTAVELDGAALEAGRGLALDDLARTGVLFSHAFAPSGDTWRSLACLHGGLHDPAREAWERWPEERESLARALARRGFRCAAFVSAEGDLDAADGEAGGLLADFEDSLLAADDLATLAGAVGWIDRNDWGDGKRVFLWVHLAGPAFPFEPVPMRDPYRGLDVDYASLFVDPASGSRADGSAEHRAAALLPDAPPPSPADRRRVVAAYDGEVALASFRAWYLLDLLRYFTRTQDSVEDAVLAVCGTGGTELERPGVPWGVHDLPHDSSLRVPLVLRHPASLTGQRIFRRVVDLADLRPTLEEWSGGEPVDLDGRSLLALTDSYLPRPFDGRPCCARVDPHPSRAEGESLPVRYTARDLRWRLVVDAACLDAGDLGAGEHALYDCERDPRERLDRAAQQPEETARLFEVLRAWVAAGGAGA